MALKWSTRRQLLYYAVAAAVGGVVLFGVWEAFFTQTPTCFDTIQNGDEGGVDCGGSCARICADVARDPVIVWRLPFKTSGSSYTAVAYIRNPNVGAGARAVPYSFSLFDGKNILVAQRDGVIDLPPTQIAPIVETNIDAGTREVARAEFSFGVRPVWLKIPAEEIPELRVSSPVPNEDYTRVSVTVTNNSVREVRDTVLVAILYDANSTALGASKSLIGRLAGKAKQQVVFTWPNSSPSAVRAEVRVLPSF